MLRKYKQRELKELARSEYADDVTWAKLDQKEVRTWERVGASYGVYGINGCVWKAPDGMFKVVTARTANAFIF